LEFFSQIVWDWDLLEEQEALDVVVQARNFGGKLSPEFFESDESSFSSIDLDRILSEQRN